MSTTLVIHSVSPHSIPPTHVVLPAKNMSLFPDIIKRIELEPDAEVHIFRADDGWYISGDERIADIGMPTPAGSSLQYIGGIPDADLFQALAEAGVRSVRIDFESCGQAYD